VLRYRGGESLIENVLPKVECVASSPDYARYVVEPLDRGFGTTLGNALRRVLLSSLAGAAVTAIKIEGVYTSSRPSRTSRKTSSRSYLT